MWKFISFLLCVPTVLNQVLLEETNATLEALKDGTYVEWATQCVFGAIDRLVARGTFNTIVYEGIDSYPQFEVSELVLRRLHASYAARNWTWEVTNGTRNHFKSFRTCLAHCRSATRSERKYKYYFNVKRTSDYYIIILDRIAECDEILHRLTLADSYNANAGFIIYYDKIARDAKRVASYLLTLLYEHKHFRCGVLLPTSLSTFTMYTFELFGANENACGQNPRYSTLMVCFKGVVVSDRVDQLLRKKLLNCTLNGELMIVPPMVISERQGVEVEILQVVSQKLGIEYNFTLHEEGTWGERLNATEEQRECRNCSLWTGPLRNVDLDPFRFGVGRVTVFPSRMMDFEYSVIYYIESMLWVVPIAQLIPAWANIITIFEWPTWLSLAGTVLLMGALTYVMANAARGREFNYLKAFSASVLASVQILLSTSIATQPKSNPVRALFISYALFMIIVGSLYQSSLINVLTNPRYEHQIDTEDEVFESGIGVGGMSHRKEIFDNPDSERDLRIYNNYEIYAKVNDTAFQWLLTVAKDQDTITILGQYYASYFIDTKHPAIVDRTGRPLVHLIRDEELYNEQVSIVFSKGFILKRHFDHIITILFESGLIEIWIERYKTVKDDGDYTGYNPANYTRDDDDEDDAPKTVVITLAHLQGAFTFLLMGELVAFVIFIVEIPANRLRRYYVRRRFRKVVHRVRMINRFKLAKQKQRTQFTNNAYNAPGGRNLSSSTRLRFVSRRTPYF